MFVFALAFAPCSLAQNDPQAIAAREFDDLRTKRDALIGDVIGLDPLATLEIANRCRAAVKDVPMRPGTVTIVEGWSLVFSDPQCGDESDETRKRMRYTGSAGSKASEPGCDDAMVWSAASDSARLSFAVPRAYSSGRYRIDGSFVRGPEFGRVRVRSESDRESLFEDDQAMAELDTRAPSIGSTGFVPLFEFRIRTERPRFVAAVLSARHGARVGTDFGIERLRLTKLGDEGEWRSVVARIAAEHGVETNRLLRAVEIEQASKSPEWNWRLDPVKAEWSSARFEFDGDFGSERSWTVEEHGVAFGAGSGLHRRSLRWPGGAGDFAAHSALDSEVLAGSLRSSSYAIDTDWLLVRCKGRCSRVVVALDAPVLGVAADDARVVDVDSGDTWEWKEIDVREWRGRSAHLEFHDDGPGWIAVRTVEGTNQPRIEPTYVYRCAGGSLEVSMTPEFARSYLLWRVGFLFSDPRFDLIEAERQAIEARLEASRR